ncbi:O-antigen ligase family protein [Streptomyces sp. NBC_01304]|uniref:O-antigen ligase family protein n=1 Tax=Streptomyces sp. NBC_01304 TaxID=2903818 RepID=UPI002E102E7D|nr:O-antigen ligase family protein [Streptomyces sp. NBC_01304]
MASAAAPPGARKRERRNVSDGAGVAVLGACAVWALITAAAQDGRPEGVLLAVLAVAAGYAGGRICGALLPAAACAAAALAGLSLAVASDASRGVPGAAASAPLGHAGAATALLVLATGAACCGAWATEQPAARLALRLLAAGIAATAAALGSTTGLVACAGVLLCSLAAARMRHRTLGLAGLACATALVTSLCWAIAEAALPEGLATALEGPLTQQRVLQWQDALALAKSDPVFGTGPGRFGELSQAPMSTTPGDVSPHSALLQQAAEQGIVGTLLLGAVFGWMLYALWRAHRSTQVVLTAAAALTALAAVASVGNALSFTPVTAGAGLLAGLATAHPLRDEWDPQAGDAEAVRSRPRRVGGGGPEGSAGLRLRRRPRRGFRGGRG